MGAERQINVQTYIHTSFCYSIQLYMCPVRVTAVLEYLESAFHLPGDVSLLVLGGIEKKQTVYLP